MMRTVRTFGIAVLMVLFGILHANAEECVILLHGLGTSSRSMRPIERFLKKHGYTVYNISYPSTRYSVEELCSRVVVPEIQKIMTKHDTLHFVTHSMGGIVVRYILTEHDLPCKSIVMLCPPNRGSELSDTLKSTIGWLYRMVMGPAGQQLGTDSASIIPKLQRLHCKVGVIAGDKSWEPYFSWIFPEKNDGKVTVSETRLQEMSDFVVLHHTHTFMMNNRDTQEHILHFIRYGRFHRE